MKILKTASGNKLKLSKKEWEKIGKKAGWMKEAQISPSQWGEMKTNINNRQLTMLQVYNQVTGANLSEDINGYEQVGESDGILKELIKPERREALMSMPEFMDTAQRTGFREEVLTAAPNFVYEILRKWFGEITRG